MGHHIGIMQGRLTRPSGRGIQFFPFENWEEEFHTAQRLGLDEIEFIFDYDDYEANPLWTEEGAEQIKRLAEETGIQVNAVCFDYFMRRPFYKAGQEEMPAIKEENTRIIKRVLHMMGRAGIGLLEIPLVDESSLKEDGERDAFREWLLEIVAETDDRIRFALETDLAPTDFAGYLESFGHPGIGANYDSGNSSGIGYDLYEEVTTLKDRIFNIHIKDRVLHGPSVRLGEGSADFEGLFQGLDEIGYSHGFILQAARGKEGEEEQTIAFQMQFIREYIKNI